MRVGLLNATVSSAESSTRVVTFPSQIIHRLLATIWILWIPVWRRNYKKFAVQTCIKPQNSGKQVKSNSSKVQNWKVWRQSRKDLRSARRLTVSVCWFDWGNKSAEQTRRSPNRQEQRHPSRTTATRWVVGPGLPLLRRATRRKTTPLWVAWK